MPTYKIGDRLDRTKLGTRLVEPSELFALKWGGKWTSAYRGGWSTQSDGNGPVNFNTLNIGSEDELYPTPDGLKAFPSMANIFKSDGPNGPLRITPRLMTAQEKTQSGTRPELQNHNWLSLAPSSLVDFKLPAYMEIKCDLPPGPNGDRQGMWRAFWTISEQGWDNGPELDVFEEFGARPTGPNGEMVARITTGFHTSTRDAWAKVDSNNKLIGGALKAAIDAGQIPAQIEWVTQGTGSQDMHVDPNAIRVYGSWMDSTGFFIFVDDVCKWMWPYATDFSDPRTHYAAADFGIGKNDSSAGHPPAGATSLGTWTIYDIGVYALGAVGTGGGTTTPPPPPPTPSPGQAISIATAIPATISANLKLAGAGSGNVNVAAFTADWAIKLSGDAAPSANGGWGLTIDATKLPLGAATACMVVGFTTPPGTSGGTSISAPFTLTRVAAPAPPPSTGGVTQAQVSAILAAQTEAENALTATRTAQAKVRTLLAALKPAT